MTYKITRFEQTGDQLFICITSKNNPVYIEHFFTEEEKLDEKGTIERLIAELELKEEEYVEPTPVISRIDECCDMKFSEKNITQKKLEIIAEKQAELLKVGKEELQQVENVVNLDSEPLINNDTLGNTVEVI
jgi:hypothetical protein